MLTVADCINHLSYVPRIMTIKPLTECSELCAIGPVSRVLVNRERDDVVEVKFVLDQSPARDASVRRDREEVEIVVEVVLLPPHLPHRVRVFACCATMKMSIRVYLFSL